MPHRQFTIDDEVCVSQPDDNFSRTSMFDGVVADSDDDTSTRPSPMQEIIREPLFWTATVCFGTPAVLPIVRHWTLPQLHLAFLWGLYGAVVASHARPYGGRFDGTAVVWSYGVKVAATSVWIARKSQDALMLGGLLALLGFGAWLMCARKHIPLRHARLWHMGAHVAYSLAILSPLLLSS